MSSPGWRPPSLLALPLDQLTKEVDLGLRVAYDKLYTLDGEVTRDAAGVLKTAHGEVTFTGSKTGIPTGLTTVLGVVAMLKSATALNEWVAGRVTPADHSKIDLFAWRPTSAADNTPVASITSRTVYFWCWGS